MYGVFRTSKKYAATLCVFTHTMESDVQFIFTFSVVKAERQTDLRRSASGVYMWAGFRRAYKPAAY